MKYLPVKIVKNYPRLPWNREAYAKGQLDLSAWMLQQPKQTEGLTPVGVKALEDAQQTIAKLKREVHKWQCRTYYYRTKNEKKNPQTQLPLPTPGHP